MQNLHSLEFLAEAKSIENGAHGTKKLMLKTQLSEDFALWSESNNKIYYSAWSRWTKYRQNQLTTLTFNECDVCREINFASGQSHCHRITKLLYSEKKRLKSHQNNQLAV